MQRNTLILITILIFVMLSILFFEFIQNINAIKVIAVNPAAESVTANYNPQITVRFSKSLTDNQKSKVKLLTNPTISGNLIWSADSKTLSLTPTKHLEVEQKYSISINWDNSSYSWNFSTPSFQSLSREEQMNIQSESDKNYSKAQTQILEKYPWFNKLPLQTKTYFVYIDTNSNTIKAILYPQTAPNVTIPVNQQVESLKVEVTKKLTDTGVDLSKIKIEWTVTPK